MAHRSLLWREAVGHELRRARHDRGERLRDVARRSGVSVPYLSEVERGRKEPSSEVLAALARALDLTLATLAARVAVLASAAATDDGEVALVLDLTAVGSRAPGPDDAGSAAVRGPLLLAA